MVFNKKHISNLSTDFVGRNQDNDNMHFEIHVTKRMKSQLHWVQYFHRISGDPTFTDLIPPPPPRENPPKKVTECFLKKATI